MILKNVLVEHNGGNLKWAPKVLVTLNYDMTRPVGWAYLKLYPNGDVFADMEIEDGHGNMFPGIGWKCEDMAAFIADGKASGEVFTIGLGKDNIDDSISPIKAYLAI